jgi:Tol biopolymer transport system component
MNTKNKMIGLTMTCLILMFSLWISSYSLAQVAINSYLPLVVNSYPVIETGKIVFISYQEGINGGEIYTVSYDGSQVTRLTNNGSEEGSPDWSPDGSKIAFVSDQSGEYEIWVMNADGTNPVQVTTMTHNYSPQWSPDGTRIAFYTRQNNDNIIYTMNPDGSGLVQVTDPAVSADEPYWSPDGTRIAYHTARTATPGIYAINADGTNPTLLLASEGIGIAYMAWSPDGARLALSRTTPDYNFDIYIYDLTTSTLTRVTTTQYNHNSVDWSPDGYYLIFHSNRDDLGYFEIYTMTTTGHRITDISNLPGDETEPDWTR